MKINKIIIGSCLIIMTLITLDLLTTIIALEFFEGLDEANPISRSIFSLGDYGYLLALIFQWLFISIIVFSIVEFNKYFYLKLTNKVMSEELSNFLLILFVSCYSVLSLFTIISNIVLIIQSF